MDHKGDLPQATRRHFGGRESGHSHYQPTDGGNVWEYVSDFYAPDYYTAQAVTDPKGPDTGKEHVARGGSFDSDPKEHLRISYRESKKAGNNVGFRCVLPDSPATNKLLQVR